MEKRNVPKLRFKGFEDECKEKRLQDICVINQGLQIAISDRFTEYKEGRHFYITNEFLKADSDKIYYIESPNESVICNKEDILMTRTGNTGKVVTNVTGAFHNNFFKVKYDKEQIVKNFMYYFLTSNKTQKNIIRLAGSSTIPDLNHKDFYNIKIKLPSLEEQTKISNFLSNVDNIIEQQEGKVKDLEQYKKGMMQKIFKQEVRFNDDNGGEYPEWTWRRLGDLCTMFSGGTPASKNKSYYEGDIPFIRSAEIRAETTELKINEIALKNSSAKLVEKGDLLYALYGATSGEVGISKINGAINQAILCIRSDKIENEYLLNLLLYNKNKIIETYIQGGQGNLSGTIIKELTYELPCLEEQTKIANFLSNIDNIIEEEKKKLENLKLWKKGLLQQMFV